MPGGLVAPGVPSLPGMIPGFAPGMMPGMMPGFPAHAFFHLSAKEPGYPVLIVDGINLFVEPDSGTTRKWAGAPVIFVKHLPPERKKARSPHNSCKTFFLPWIFFYFVPTRPLLRCENIIEIQHAWHL